MSIFEGKTPIMPIMTDYYGNYLRGFVLSDDVLSDDDMCPHNQDDEQDPPAGMRTPPTPPPPGSPIPARVRAVAQLRSVCIPDIALTLLKH